MHVFVSVFVYACVCVCVCVCMCLCLCLCMHVFVSVFVYACVCVHNNCRLIALNGLFSEDLQKDYFDRIFSSVQTVSGLTATLVPQNWDRKYTNVALHY